MKKMSPVIRRKHEFYRFKNQNDRILLQSSDSQKPNLGNESSDFPMAFSYRCVSCFMEALMPEIMIVVMQRDVFDYGQRATVLSHLDIWDRQDIDAKKKLKNKQLNPFPQLYVYCWRT